MIKLILLACPFYVQYDLVQTLVHSPNDFCSSKKTSSRTACFKNTNPCLFFFFGCLIASCHSIGTMWGISYQQNSKLCSSILICLAKSLKREKDFAKKKQDESSLLQLLLLLQEKLAPNVHFRNIVEVKQQMVADLSFVKKRGGGKKKQL